MKRIGVLLVLCAGCTSAADRAVQEHQANGARAWACEHMAEAYRKDPVAQPDLCEGYGPDGWPIDGAAQQ